MDRAKPHQASQVEGIALVKQSRGATNELTRCMKRDGMGVEGAWRRFSWLQPQSGLLGGTLPLSIPTATSTPALRNNDPPHKLGL